MRLQKNTQKEALTHLAKDPIMKKLIDRYVIGEWKKYGNSIFLDIIDAIISQQLSGKASEAISTRFKRLFNSKNITPSDVLSISDNKLRKCGLSFIKIKYIKGLCDAINVKLIDVDNLGKLPDEEVKSELTKIKGVGRWTAEMILLFSLKRQDIFSLGDLGLRTAVSVLYGVDRDDMKKIEEISLTWKPYRSIASKYLWKSLAKKP